jgi:hypothetical protein
MKVMRGTLRRSAKTHRENGQSLLETAVAIPLLLIIAFNTINLAYFWFMVLALSAAPRQGAEFLSQGGVAALSTAGLPTSANACSLVMDNVGNGIMHSSSQDCSGTAAQIRLCSSFSSGGVNTSTGVANCDSYGSSLISLSAPAADPEQPRFVLQRVDVVYQVSPIISGTVFNVVMPSTLKFHRQVSMRSLY